MLEKWKQENQVAENREGENETVSLADEDELENESEGLSKKFPYQQNFHIGIKKSARLNVWFA